MSSPKYDFEALKSLKTKRNLSAQALSDLSGVPVSTVNRVLRGEGDPGVSTVVSLVHAMGGSLDDICGFPRPSGSEALEGYKLVIAHQQDTIQSKERWLLRVAAACGILMLFVIGLFTYDLTHMDRGWIQTDEPTQSQT